MNTTETTTVSQVTEAQKAEIKANIKTVKDIDTVREAGIFTDSELDRMEIAILRGDLLRASQKGSSIKVSAKGCVSVYGLGRFPVTLYKGQWDRLLAMKEDIVQFMADHDDQLAKKEA